MIKCEYCKDDFENYDVRPYGHKGAMICFDCGMKPDNKAEVERNFGMQLDRALLVSERVIIGEGTGPRPLNGKSLV